MPASSPIGNGGNSCCAGAGATRRQELRRHPHLEVQVAALLERNKRYPPVAQARGERVLPQVLLV